MTETDYENGANAKPAPGPDVEAPPGWRFDALYNGRLGCTELGVVRDAEYSPTYVARFRDSRDTDAHKRALAAAVATLYRSFPTPEPAYVAALRKERDALKAEALTLEKNLRTQTGWAASRLEWATKLRADNDALLLELAELKLADLQRAELPAAPRPATATLRETVAAPPPSTPAERIVALANFLGRFAPAVGERHDGCHKADDDVRGEAMLVARDDAIVTAFETVERLCRQC